MEVFWETLSSGNHVPAKTMNTADVEQGAKKNTLTAVTLAPWPRGPPSITEGT